MSSWHTVLSYQWCCFGFRDASLAQYNYAGTCQALHCNSRWRHFGPLDFVFRAFQLLKPCDTCTLDPLLVNFHQIIYFQSLPSSSVCVIQMVWREFWIFVTYEEREDYALKLFYCTYNDIWAVKKDKRLQNVRIVASITRNSKTI